MAVLGIDAAWTEKEPSGVALIVQSNERWHALRVASSYHDFCGEVNFQTVAPVVTQTTNVPRLLTACKRLAPDSRIAVVAVDMPLSRQPIRARRASDTAVSRRFGHCQCAVHSPSPERPGKTGRRLHQGLSDAGFILATSERMPYPALIEVYPHVALLGLTGRSKRLPYKAGRTNSYWRGASIADRKRKLLEEWHTILDFLRRDIDNVDLTLSTPDTQTFQSLKRYEDALDGLICAWVATQYLAGTVESLGDKESAIWVPASSMKFAKDIHAT